MKGMIPAISCIALLPALCCGAARAGDLVVALVGVPNAKGNIRIALYNDEGRWGDDVEARKTLRSCLCAPQGKKTARGTVSLTFNGKTGAHPIIVAASEARDGKLTVNISGLKPGQYAVSLFHDQNGDGVMNMKPLLLVAETPAEPFGLSNNFNPLKSLRAPKFRDCSFTVGAGRTEREILLR